ncbi:nitrous oxide reductase accessory protein NosL [Microvirga rosea]|nr:nitrous oxide reductase accessory protein NosL [Microvirga rosea]MCB8820558.1 nitrous oxide reductase accessory protein NosL [Microvirga rosea]
MKITFVTVLAGMLALAGCNDMRTAEPVPLPKVLTAAAIGHYCGMNVLEHAGPKGQIILASRKDPVWFSSARDAISFTMLPEEPKDIRAIYVSDMAKAPSWNEPGTTNWVDARQASFVIGSRVKSGMGAEEAVPFSEKAAAEKFAVENGGRIVTFEGMPRDYILGAGETTSSVEEQGAAGQHDQAPSQQNHAH